MRARFCPDCRRSRTLATYRKSKARPEAVERANALRRQRYRDDPAFAEARKQRAHEYRLAHPEHVAEKKREWSRLHPEKVREAVERSRQRHPERAFARGLVKQAIIAGRLVPQPCWCGSAATEAHHHNGYDLAHVFDVVWLCIKHHREQHRKYPR